jgi:hypothetical protein
MGQSQGNTSQALNAYDELHTTQCNHSEQFKGKIVRTDVVSIKQYAHMIIRGIQLCRWTPDWEKDIILSF